jgi:hypothetical protein
MFKTIIAVIIFLAPFAVYLLDFSYSEYHDSAADLDDFPDINILQTKMAKSDDILSFFISVQGKILNGNDNENYDPNTDTIRIFMDVDVNSKTGYYISGLGADYMAEFHGMDGSPVRSSLYIYNSNYRTSKEREQNDWNAWDQIIKPLVATSCNKLETQFSINNYRNKQSQVHDQVLAIVQATDANNNQDFSDRIISDKQELLLVTQKNIAAEVLTAGEPEVLELELTTFGSDITVNSITFQHEGGGDLIPLSYPIEIEQDTTKTCSVRINTTSTKQSASMNTKIGIKRPQDIVIADDVPVILLGTGANAYVNSPPENIVIDGLFSDWENVEKNSDDDDSVGNPNVDISSYSVVDSPQKLSFYLNVEGDILAGTELPVKPFTYHPNEPVSKQNKVEVGTNENNPLPDLPIKTGEDAIYIFIDADNMHSTGYTAADHLSIGADYVIELSGQNGEILNHVAKKFNAKTQEENPWSDITQVSDLQTACAGAELETQIVTRKFSEFSEDSGCSVYIHIIDWSGEVEDNVLISGSPINNIDSSVLEVNRITTREITTVIVKTFSDTNFEQSTNEFKHNDIVYFTMSDGYHNGGMKTATVANDDTGPDSEIVVLVYDDGTHYDALPNDGVFTGSFTIQSVAIGGNTNDEFSIIAVESSVKVTGEFAEPYFGDPKPLAPEFGDLLFILPLILILILITKYPRIKNKGRNDQIQSQPDQKCAEGVKGNE